MRQKIIPPNPTENQILFFLRLLPVYSKHRVTDSEGEIEERALPFGVTTARARSSGNQEPGT